MSQLFNTLSTKGDTGVPFHWNFNSILKKDHKKKFLWTSRLRVGRRKEPILGYFPKNDEKNNLVHKRVKTHNKMSLRLGLWHKHISCPNASVFIDFGLDWYFMLVYSNFCKKIKILNVISILSEVDENQRIWIQKKCQCHSPNYYDCTGTMTALI